MPRAAAAQEAGVWRINGQAAELEGYAEFHPAAAGGAGRVLARLTRMALPESEAQAVSRLLDSAAPTRPPALDIVVEALELRGKRLGRVEVQAQNRAGGGWQLDRLRLVNPDARFEATGEWATAPDSGQRLRAGIDFQLDILDGGALLGRLGQPGVVQGAKGRMSGRIAWLGSPFEIDYPSLSGQMNVAIERGPVPAGRPRRRQAARRAEPAVAAAPPAVRLPRPLREGLRLRQRHRRRRAPGGRRDAPTTCACAACRRWC